MSCVAMATVLVEAKLIGMGWLARDAARLEARSRNLFRDPEDDTKPKEKDSEQKNFCHISSPFHPSTPPPSIIREE
ncbi:hypothetical protein AAES_49799 [Amazona aestiva]|uniref:Uncharacterized protein n=1 Tax=Amazona aestiva TaxID=12930 RepID=A0A0Q3UTG0_AMAAE|nr:hypothetical protein AAES_49799 [Amazona aestiva]